MQFQRKYRLVFLTMALLSFVTTDYALSDGTPDVHFVPTPQYVVNEMLEMAGINKNDIVYDLGCGDGRFVITAAAKFGARGVGIDIDPQRILESQDNAQRAGVWDRVKFYEKNLFHTDISQATIVALYLLPDLNLTLRPKLFQELKPGTRVVSHDFDMKDWKPDDTGELGSSSYYLWIIPADVAGKWSLNSPPLGLDKNYSIQITQKFQDIEVSTASKREGETISDEKLRGDKISFLLIREKNRNKVAMHFKGQVKGNTISGNVQVEGGLFEGVHEWTATR
jgi:SAM-dependent methyltransferase